MFFFIARDPIYQATPIILGNPVYGDGKPLTADPNNRDPRRPQRRRSTHEDKNNKEQYACYISNYIVI